MNWLRQLGDQLIGIWRLGDWGIRIWRLGDSGIRDKISRYPNTLITFFMEDVNGCVSMRVCEGYSLRRVVK